MSIEFHLPRVTIVTPSYNHADYLEETIRSVLLQGYPNLEYFVIDGGSTDGSIEIIQKYEPWLAGWVSETDCGQSNAINKGFARATGEWMGWLNSDDCFAPNAIYNLLNTAHIAQSDFVYGSCIHFGESRMYPYIKKPGPRAFDFDFIRMVDWLDQPTTLWKQRVFEECGPLSEDMHFGFDWEFFIKCARSSKGAYSPSVIAVYRFHSDNKTLMGDIGRSEELIRISLEYLPNDTKEGFVRIIPIIRFLANLREIRGKQH
ncbi:MAG: glycosyltransferase family 2 protein, partial [Chloroflexota bacterium]